MTVADYSNEIKLSEGASRKRVKIKKRNVSRKYISLTPMLTMGCIHLNKIFLTEYETNLLQFSRYFIRIIKNSAN